MNCQLHNIEYPIIPYKFSLYMIITHVTILYYNNKGHIAEQGSPNVLLQRENGKFRGMCEASGDWERLSNILTS